MARVTRALLLLFVLSVTGAPSRAEDQAPRVAVPVDPIAAILDAFHSHSLVALGEPHGNEQAQAFRAALIRDPKFADVVDDVVVEFGNSRYQDVIDRFVNGDNVPDATLRQVWQNTTVANFVWDRPIYEEFFRVVRDVNVSRPTSKHVRVLLGDPPIEWTAVHTPDDLLNWLRKRDAYPAEIIRRQVLAKNRHALLIYGEGHFWRNGAGENLVQQLETGDAKMFTISTPIMTELGKLQPDISEWAKPSLALIRGTTLGATEFARFFTLPNSSSLALRMEDQVDAVLYLGTPSSMTNSRLAAALCADSMYIEMRVRRMALDPGPPGAPPPLDRLKQNCGIAPHK